VRTDDTDREAWWSADLVGRAVARDPDSPLWGDRQFLDWLAAELHAIRPGHATREPSSVLRRSVRRKKSDDAALLAEADAMIARVRARRLRVRRAIGRPRLRAPSTDGTPSTVLSDAAVVRAAPMVDLAVAAGSGRELWDEPVESWIDVPLELEGGPFLALSISGDSMVPLVHTGDTVLVRVSPVVRMNTVVVARHPEDGYVCKWVRSVGRRRLTLASLDPSRADVVIPHDRSLIVGTVVVAWCHHDRAVGAMSGVSNSR